MGGGIYEDYFRGAFVNELHVLNSITKSVGSALIGIANRQGKIQPEDALPKFFSALYPMNPAYCPGAYCLETTLQYPDYNY